MRVAVVSQWFTDGLGYSENLLPKGLARQGVEVHIISGQGQVYASTPLYDSVYREVLGDPVLPVGVGETEFGIPLHRVKSLHNVPDPHALERRLNDIQPDVVQTFAILDGWSTVAAAYCRERRALLFTENHVHDSVLPRGAWQTPRGHAVGLANRVRPVAQSINRTTRKCFAISADTARIASGRYGVPKSKVVVEPLGVDTGTFFEEHLGRDRDKIRSGLGYGPSEVVCIYTGRLSPDKAPVLLARAVASLQAEGLNYRSLFVGAGSPDYVADLASYPGSSVLPFRPTRELADLYFAADIGVWPREESTSQLDLMATGRPLIVSSKVEAKERLGVGAVYDEGDAASLAQALRSLSDLSVRHPMGSEAARRIRTALSWDAIAKRRLAHYEESPS